MLDGIQSGFSKITYDHLEITKKTYAAVANFFACPLEYKKQFLSQGSKSHGYFCLTGKEFFTIRESNVPLELAPCLDYIRMVHSLACSCLQTIAEKIGLPSEKMLRLVSADPLPESKISSSLFRIFSYVPNVYDEECTNFSSEPHQDIGLLTLIPPSTHPALEIFDYSDKGCVATIIFAFSGQQ